jgi:hypothetical protein
MKSGILYWLKFERDRARQLLNLYELGIDKVTCSRLGRTPEDITASEIERLRTTIAEFTSFIDRDTA